MDKEERREDTDKLLKNVDFKLQQVEGHTEYSPLIWSLEENIGNVTILSYEGYSEDFGYSFLAFWEEDEGGRVTTEYIEDNEMNECLVDYFFTIQTGYIFNRLEGETKDIAIKVSSEGYGDKLNNKNNGTQKI